MVENVSGGKVLNGMFVASRTKYAIEIIKAGAIAPLVELAV